MTAGLQRRGCWWNDCNGAVVGVKEDVGRRNRVTHCALTII